MRRGWIILTVLAAIGTYGDAIGQEQQDTADAWAPGEHVRAFYSGHSLSDGVPEAVGQIARSLGHQLDFEVQSVGYSLLRQRAQGEGLNVAEELRQPGKYDVLVVTERHDLPKIARDERTAFHLADMARHMLAGNSDGEVLFYHTWLNLDLADPLPWVDYERTVAAMWECVASRANLDLPARSSGVPRVRVLPGGSALAELVAALWEGTVPGIEASDPGTRVRLLFSDDVHMSEIGRYFMGLVHYAVLFGQSPEGAEIPGFLPVETGRAMQQLAWQHAATYGRGANAAAQHDMAACRDLMANEVCPAYAAFRQGTRVPILGALKRQSDTSRCRRTYSDGQDPDNPFAAPGN